MLRSPVLGTFPLGAASVVFVVVPVAWAFGMWSRLRLFSPRTSEIPSDAGTVGAAGFGFDRKTPTVTVRVAGTDPVSVARLRLWTTSFERVVVGPPPA